MMGWCTTQRALSRPLLAYAMRQVTNGADSLTNSVTVYSYPDNRNGLPASDPNLCPNPGDEVPGNATSMSLQDVLSGMMRVSNNRFTRAIELRYGRANLQAYASSLGMGSTRLLQIFGCGADGGVQNTWSLDDAGRLYEAMVNGSAVPASAKDQSLGMMLSFPGSSIGGISVGSIINSEASALGISGAARDFASSSVLRIKGGSYDICYGSCGDDDVVTRDEAGF